MFLFKRNNGYYYFYFNDPITNKRKAITTKCKDLKSAKKFMQSYNVNEVKPVSPVIYLETLENEVLKYVTDNLTRGTLLTYINAFKQVKRILGNKPIKLYNARDFEHYKAVRIETISKTTCNIEVRVLKAIFNLAVKWNWLDRNPLKDVKQFAIPEKKPLALSQDEINRVLNVIDKPVIKNIVIFALNTACRINEILNVQYKDIDLTDRVLTIGNKDNFTTKSKKVRHIPINDKLLDLLNNLLPVTNVIELNPNETYLFNNKGYRLNRDYVSKEFKKCLRKAGLSEMYHFHSTRHTAITNLVKAGANIRFVQQIAGHAHIQTTELYSHVQINDLRKAINLL